MAKIHHAQAVCGRKKVFRRFADGHTEPADELDVEEAKRVKSTLITDRVAIQLGVRGANGEIRPIENDRLSDLSVDWEHYLDITPCEE